MTDRDINQVLLSKGWEMKSVQTQPLFNNKVEHHWQVINTCRLKRYDVWLKWRIANENDMKKTEGLPRCNFSDSFRQGLEINNEFPSEMENPFQNIFETPV